MLTFKIRFDAFTFYSSIGVHCFGYVPEYHLGNKWALSQYHLESYKYQSLKSHLGLSRKHVYMTPNFQGRMNSSNDKNYITNTIIVPKEIKDESSKAN